MVGSLNYITLDLVIYFTENRSDSIKYYEIGSQKWNRKIFNFFGHNGSEFIYLVIACVP